MEHKVSDATICVCVGRRYFVQMDAANFWRLKALEQENARRKRLLTEGGAAQSELACQQRNAEPADCCPAALTRP
jgi:hypothetical protein